MTWIGRYYHYQSQHKLAISSFENALKIIAHSDKYFIKCTLYAFLSGSYEHLLDIAQSEKWAKECIYLAEKNDDPAWIAVGNEFLSENAFFVGRWKEALEFASQDIDIGLKIGAQDRIAWGTFCKANALLGLGRLEEALEVGKSSLDIAEQIGEHRLATWIVPLLSMIQSDLDADEEAESLAREGIKKADELEQVVLQCWSRFAYIKLLVKQNKWEEALHLSEEGKNLYLPTENILGRQYIQIVFPEVFLGLNLLAEAEAAVDEATNLLREHNVMQNQGMALRIKGQILMEKGEHDKAAEVLQESIDILSALGSQLELGRTYYHRGRLYSVHNLVDKAEQDLEQAALIFKNCGAKTDLRIVKEFIKNQ